MNDLFSSAHPQQEEQQCIHILDEQREIRSLVRALRSCASPQKLIKGRLLHKQILNGRCSSNRFLQNSIVEMYGKCGSLEEARQAFDSITCPNTYSYNMMISAYARNGHLDKARDTFEGMPVKELVTWNTIVAAYAQLGHISEAEALFERIPEKDVVSWNTMLAAYVQRKEFAFAKRWFSGIPAKNIVSWNTMIAAAWDFEAIRLLGLLDLEGVEANRTTFVVVIEACASETGLAAGRIILSEVSAIGLDCDVVIGTVLIKMLGNCGCVELGMQIFQKMSLKNSVTWNTMVTKLAENGHLEEARGLYEQMPDGSLVAGNALLAACFWKGSVPEAKIFFEKMRERDVVTWTTMVSALAENGHENESLLFFKNMIVEGVPPDQVALVTALDACCKARAMTDGKEIQKIVRDDPKLQQDGEIQSAIVKLYSRCACISDAREALGDEPEPEVAAAAWNSIIAAHVESKSDKHAVVLFRRMIQEGTRPSEATLAIVCEACAGGASLIEARAIHSSFCEDENMNLANKTLVATALINMYGKLGSLQNAANTFNKLRKKNVISWTVMINTTAQLGDPEAALVLFHEMNLDGIQPDDMAMTGVLNACSHSGLFNESIRWFGSMASEFGVHPTIDHYVCVIDLLGRTGQVPEAEFFISKMPFEANEVAWTTLLGACRNSGDISRGAAAAKNAFRSDPQNSGPYMLLSHTVV